MTQAYEAFVEKVAQVICEADGLNWEDMTTSNARRWYVAAARAVLAVVRAELQTVTPGMRVAWEDVPEKDYRSAGANWSAMLRASALGKA